MAVPDLQWPPDYVKTYKWRLDRLAQMRADPDVLKGAKEYYATRPAEFIDHWLDTYDPRLAGTGRLSRMPLRLFPRQKRLIEFLEACRKAEVPGLIDKSRTMGATFVCGGYSVWLWLFVAGAAVGWGSRKEELVDRLGDPKSVFEKIRGMITSLPREFLPVGYMPREHSSFMRLINPETSSTITGEAGDNIGRGGRTLIYFKDESAHYIHPDLIEAALSQNTRVQIDISTVNGPATVFQRRRDAGVEWVPGCEMQRTCANVFVMDWRDHPDMTQAWYDEQKARHENSGLLHVFAQEVDRNPSAALTGTVVPLDWFRAAIDADKALGFTDDGMWAGALDVADNDGVGDRNAGGTRKGPCLKSVDEWGERDTAYTARRMIKLCEDTIGEGNPLDVLDVAIQYDCIGVGSGVKAEANRLQEEELMPEGARFIAWNAGAGVCDPDEHVIPDDKQTPLNKDFFDNRKAQGWWNLRRRFERTWRARTQGVKYDPADLISIPSTLPKLRQLEKEVIQPTASKGRRLKMVIDKTPDGQRSPNLGDMLMMLYDPEIEYQPPTAVVGTWSRTGR